MNEYLEDGLKSLKDISEGAVPPEVYYLSAKAVLEHINNLQSKIDKAIEYIEKDTRWFDYEYASVYGELCDCEGYNANRLEVMVNPSNVLNILKEDK